MGDSEADDILMVAIVSYYSGELNDDQADVLINWIDLSADNLSFFKSIGDIWYASGLLSKQEYCSLKSLDKLKGCIKSGTKSRETK